MARGINVVHLIGNLGNDPETKYTQGGTCVTTISLATTSVRKDKDGNNQERTEWHRVKLFGKLGEIAAEYLKKGAPVYIQGSIRYDEFTGDDGVKRYFTDIVADGVITEDRISGETTRHELDVLIYGTGFSATGFLQPMEVIGRDGADLQARWAHGAAAYRGVAVPGFPNFFMLYGPNTNLGGNSIIVMLEAQIGYIAQGLAEMRRLDLDTIEVRADEADEFAAWVAEQSKTTAWVTDCHSWYTTEGHNTNNWPALTFRYRQLMERFNLFAYEARPRPADSPAASGAALTGAVR